ncbi:unnamed protein product [Dovyalis caffra]|uniref:Uncharacterized protein n=1 Tax=Dovyalis caffra TaxID=77055 RepID=A0AAV1SGX9_9ROSI|nr:unnamed protein product [Dovyalis caffra]
METSSNPIQVVIGTDVKYGHFLLSTKSNLRRDFEEEAVGQLKFKDSSKRVPNSFKPYNVANLWEGDDPVEDYVEELMIDLVYWMILTRLNLHELPRQRTPILFKASLVAHTIDEELSVIT